MKRWINVKVKHPIGSWHIHGQNTSIHYMWQWEPLAKIGKPSWFITAGIMVPCLMDPTNLFQAEFNPGTTLFLYHLNHSILLIFILVFQFIYFSISIIYFYVNVFEHVQKYFSTVCLLLLCYVFKIWIIISTVLFYA